MIDMVFNERSLECLAPSLEEARARGTDFVDTLAATRKHRVNRQLRTQKAFIESLLAKKYSWRDWINDPVVNREKRLYLKSLATRAPFLDGLHDAQDQSMACDVLFKGSKAEGLGAAYFINGLSVSLMSEPCWNADSLSATVCELDEDGELIQSEIKIHHASHSSHMETHVGWIQETFEKSVSSGSDLWERREQFFPSLDFCEKIQEQMLNLPKDVLSSFIRGLSCLEKYCQGWVSGGFNLFALGCQASSEGEVAKKQFKAERTFSCQGQTISFAYHVKLGDPWTIYFDPAPGPGGMYVGYVGRHLRNKRDR
ncbi:MAG: hypothetical protein HQL73_03115 [Magnetococcales bacterium]|nr:hypothetical protein [Magnetococcales bacterium]